MGWVEVRRHTLISIGAHYRGPELEHSRIRKLINLASRTVAQSRGAEYDDRVLPTVNVVFYVPGSLGDFDIPKIEVSRYSARYKLVLVAVPVPRTEVEAGGTVGFVVDAMRNAVALARDEFVQRKVVNFDVDKAESIVQKVHQALAAEAERSL